MAGKEIKDRTEELIGKFKDTIDRFMNPVENHNVSLQDVLDARKAVVDHRSMLAREGIIQHENTPRKAE